MTTQTLKELIEIEFDRCENISEFKANVFRLIDLYGKDDTTTFSKSITFPIATEPDEVPYGTICSCNPLNGGSGMCGCVMANKLVKNPKKYGDTFTTNMTTSMNTILL
jgi:hypothetical protein